nr:NAD(P)-binding domain-containing protein [Marinicella sp. W31]MDC2875497.1 NAD(P)-binding domain-containing protein [Marinicella sp. W31]
MTEQIAVIGAGIMGTAIATRLLETGHTVIVSDLDDAKVAKLVEKGASAATSPKAATSGAGFTIMSLNHADIVRAVVFGSNGVAEAASADKLLIDMSSIDPKATAEMSAELSSATGMGWVDCPLSGGAPGALGGRLTVMAGGTEENFEKLVLSWRISAPTTL